MQVCVSKFGSKIHAAIDGWFSNSNPRPKLSKKQKKTYAQFEKWWESAGIKPVKGKSEFVVHDSVEKVAGTVDLLAKKDKKLPKALRDLLSDDKVWSLYKPTGHEINLLRELFPPLGKGSKAGYREALRLVREFTHSF